MDKLAKLIMESIVIYPPDMIVLQVTKLILSMSLNVILMIKYHAYETMDNFVILQD
jgi:hypothetical protein